MGQERPIDKLSVKELQSELTQRSLLTTVSILFILLGWSGSGLAPRSCNASPVAFQGCDPAAIVSSATAIM